MIFLKTFLDESPSALQLFPFKDEFPLADSNLFKGTSVAFANGINTAILYLDNEEKLITFLRTWGKNFADRAKPEHYDKMASAILSKVAEALKPSDELIEAKKKENDFKTKMDATDFSQGPRNIFED